MSNPLDAIRQFDEELEARVIELMKKHNGDKRKVISAIYREFNEVIGTDVIDDIVR